MRKLNRRRLLLLLLVISGFNECGSAFAQGKLAFLGPRGTYSDQAATNYVSHKGTVATIPLRTITEISQYVIDGRVQFGLLPFENSTAGFVGETRKLLLALGDPGLRVISESSLPINSNLMVKPGTMPADLKAIVSHPEALRECTKWLDSTLPTVQRVNANSTAEAAEQVAMGDGTTAAIASLAAAQLYHLQIINSRIQDDDRNTTIFFVVQSASSDFPDQHPSRLIVKLSSTNRSDAFSRLINHMNNLTFSLAKVDSYPTGGLDSYRFLLTFDSKRGADISKIRSILGPDILLIGAYNASSISQ